MLQEGTEIRSWAHSVLAGYPWSSRRGLDRVHPGAEAALGRAGFDLAARDPRGFLAVEPADTARPAAVAPVRYRAMESAAFGFGVVGIDAVISPPDGPGRSEAIRRVLRQAIDRAEEDISLIVLKVDAADVEALDAAQRSGFAIYDVALTWLADRAAIGKQLDPPPGLTIEVHHDVVDGILDHETVERLAARTAAWDLNHYRADPRVPRDAIERFYGSWVPNIGAGRWSDQLAVVRDDDEVLAIYSAVIDQTLQAELGVVLMSDTWMVSDGAARGIAPAMLSAGAHQTPLGARYTEWETQARNLTTLRAVDAAGARPIRSSYTLHAWLDRG